MPVFLLLPERRAAVEVSSVNLREAAVLTESGRGGIRIDLGTDFGCLIVFRSREAFVPRMGNGKTQRGARSNRQPKAPQAAELCLRCYGITMIPL